MFIWNSLKTEWQAILTALTFLTALPFPQPTYHADNWKKSNCYYPLAGYVVGLCVALTLLLPFPREVVAALGVAVWLFVTGFLHWDGLVDSADALLVAKSPPERLSILKDVHVGAFGLGVGGLYLLLLFALLQHVTLFEVIVAAVWARTLLLFSMFWWPSARSGAQAMGAHTRRGAAEAWRTALLWAAPTLLIWDAWLAVLGAALSVWGLSVWAARRLGGGLTGDIYGALVVVAEIAALLVFCVQ